MQSARIDTAKLVSITTDEAPAMTGKGKGIVTRMKEVHPQLVAFHCIIHRSALCSKLCD